MELRQLRYFVAVAEELHFGRAASRLHITQPPLSQQIHALEREIGADLLHRDKRHVELTDAGRAFLEHARGALNEAQQARTSAVEAAAGRLGRLFVGCSPYVRWWPPVETILRSLPERINVQLSYGASGGLLRQLRTGQLDMAMVVGPVRHNEFGRMRVTREPYFLALPERHPLAGRASVRIEELGEETLLIFTRRLSPDQFDDQIALFKDAGATMRIVEVPAESGGLLGGVAAGHGIGLLPRPSHPYPGTVQVPLGPPLRYVDLNLAWRESQRTPLVQSVLDLVEDLASDGRLGGSSTDVVPAERGAATEPASRSDPTRPRTSGKTPSTSRRSR